MSIVKKPVNKWIAHVQAYKAEHECSYAQALKESKSTYVKPTKTKTKKTVSIVEVDGTDEVVEPVTPVKKKRAYVRKTKPKPLDEDVDETV